ncbi:unnamed protein product [Schistosoma intercalatum]|nr:unnamed protein product [Schistosoma intercalatum]
MNKFLPTSQIDWLLMDKPTVDPILLGLDEHNDNGMQEINELFSNTCEDLHRKEHYVADSSNQFEVDGGSCVDSECHEPWETNFCSSGINVTTSGTPRYKSSITAGVTKPSQSTLKVMYDERDVFGTMKCDEPAYQSCEGVAKTVDRHNALEYSRSLTPTEPFIKRRLTTQEVPEHSPISTAIHCHFRDTGPLNSFGLFQSSNKTNDSLTLRSDFPNLEVGSFAPLTEPSCMFSTPTVMPSVDSLNHRETSEVDSQILKETEKVSPNSSPVCRRPGLLKGSGPSSPSAAHHCSLCGKQYRHVASLRNHMRKHTTGAFTSKRYKCNHCVYSSQYHRNVIKHMEATHRDHEALSTNNMTVFPEMGSAPCDSVASDDLKLDFINSRVWIPCTKAEPNACCTMSGTTDSKDFPIFSNVEQSTGFPAPNLEPHIVSRQISSNYGSRMANKHYESDHVGNLGTVMSCDQAFQSVKYLSNHIKDSHRDIKRFKCPLEGCSFCGLRRMHLKRHITEFHSDKKLSLYKMLDQNRLNHEPYNSVQPVMMYGRQEGLSLNVPKLSDSQPLKRQCYNSQMNNYVPLDPSYASDNSYHNPSCRGSDVYSFPMSGFSHPSGDCCVSEDTDSMLFSHTASKSFEQKPHSYIRMSSQINRPFGNTSSSNMPFHNEQRVSVNKARSINPSSDFHIQSPYPLSVSNQSAHYHQRDPNTLDNDLQLSCEIVNSESLQKQQEFFSQNAVYSNVKSLSFSSNDPSTNRMTEPDVVEQLLDSTSAPNIVLDQILCEPIEPNKDDEVRVETSTLSTATVNTSQISPLNSKVLSNNVKSSVSGANMSINIVHTSNMLSETDAFLSDLQEILERDMPMLTSSTPKGLDSSELVLVTVKEAISESKSPTGITGCKLTSTSSLPSTDSGHECWSSSSSCSVGPTNASTWGQQEATTPLKVSSPSSSSYPSNQPSGTNHSTPSIFDNQVTEQIINEQFSDHDSHDQLSSKCSNTLHCAAITVDGMPVTPQMSSVVGSHHTLPLKSNKNVRLNNASQLFHGHSSYPHSTNFVQNSQSPTYNSENPRLQYSQDHSASNQISSMYRFSGDQSMNQQSSVPFYSSHNSYVSSDLTSNQTMFSCQQNEAQQMCQYSFNPSSLHSEPTYHSSYVQPKYQNYRHNETDVRLTPFKNYPPNPQEQVYWQPNAKYRTDFYEQMPNNPPISCRNIVFNTHESYPFENSMPYSQNSSISTRVTDSILSDNENKSTHNLRHSDQLSIQNSTCPTPKYVNFPDTDNLPCDRTFQTTQQPVSKRWPTQEQHLFNPYSSYPSSNYTHNLQMTSPMYPVRQPPIHSISRVRSEDSNSCINSSNRIQNHGSYFSNQPPSASQYFSNSACYSQSRSSHVFSPHSQYTPSQSVYRDMSQHENYLIGDRRYCTSQSNSTIQANIRHSNMGAIGNWSVDKNSSYSGNQQDTIIPQGINNTNVVGYSTESNPANIDQHPDSCQQFIPNPQNSHFISDSVDHVNSSLDNPSSRPLCE